jgi:hypothetical protein
LSISFLTTSEFSDSLEAPAVAVEWVVAGEVAVYPFLVALVEEMMRLEIVVSEVVVG